MLHGVSRADASTLGGYDMKNLNQIKDIVSQIRKRAEVIEVSDRTDKNFGAFQTMADLNEMPEAGYAASNGATLTELDVGDIEIVRLCNQITLSRDELKRGG